MSKLMDKIKKAGAVPLSEVLSDSAFFSVKDMVPTSIPALNIALSGKIDGGLSPGLTVLAGPSRHFKSMLGLIMVKAYLDRHEDAICIFVDSEFGITPSYIRTIGIDTDRVLHVPVEHIEQLKFDLVKRLEAIERGDKVIIFIDSIGNIASKKEVDDASDGKSVADMTRARSMKSLFRIITPHFTTKDIPCVVINHVYQEMGLFPKTIMSGGTGGYYSANTIIFIGRQQEKKGTELEGYNFILNIEKSRYVKEKSKIPLTVRFEGGVNKWSGLLDIAVAGGFVVKPKNGWYAKVDIETGEIEGKNYRLKETENKDFWMPLVTSEKFREYIANTYQIGYNDLMVEEEEEMNVSNDE